MLQASAAEQTWPRSKSKKNEDKRENRAYFHSHIIRSDPLAGTQYEFNDSYADQFYDIFVHGIPSGF